MKQKSPVIFGEVLFDEFENDKSILGGAPFNVAWHLQGFGLCPLFVSRIGEDAKGEEIVEKMKDWNMSLDGLQYDQKNPTGIVSVKTKKGEPEFKIHDKQAYDYIEYDPIKSIINKNNFSLLYHGSLSIRNKQSHDSLYLIKQNLGIKIFVDVNLRKPWWRDDLIKKIIRDANWLKCNDSELDIISRMMNNTADNVIKTAENICTDLSLEFIIVTRGDKGAFIYDRHENLIETDNLYTPNVVDTVGAGDAFSAVTIYGILNNWDKNIILSRAIDFASKICEIQGATLNNHKYYQYLRNKWEKENGNQPGK